MPLRKSEPGGSLALVIDPSRTVYSCGRADLSPSEPDSVDCLHCLARGGLRGIQLRPVSIPRDDPDQSRFDTDQTLRLALAFVLQDSIRFEPKLRRSLSLPAMPSECDRHVGQGPGTWL